MLRILFTGCRGGIGLQAAEKLLKAGHFVYVTVHEEESVPEVKKILEEYAENCHVEKLDITVSEDRNKIREWDLDVLVNNAAIGDSGPLAEIDPDRLRKVFETNVISAIEVTQIALQRMIKNKKGRIVFMGSMAGLLPTPFLAPYAMSKFTLESVVFSLRTELKPFSIPVVMINPGSYKTGFNEKNINRKYEWFNHDGIYKDHISAIKKAEMQILGLEVSDLNSISDKVVEAVTDKHPKRRYEAPWWQWIFVPLGRRLM
ncbi:MAG TPA: SDR family NAD(P)-dependent oxidoreductase [Ignavibacteria bacterium]|nr:SDR family NAD(P)-dependent oxidoreductase [Ignavibacteria bacterium]HMR40658.1 SDR family NAD(P)-dependent oxidoreductase [Ignavibacteria bacterium]